MRKPTLEGVGTGLLAIGLTLSAIVFTQSQPVKAVSDWQRSMLAYHSDSRSSDAWKRHLMRINTDGSFNGQWLFNAAILTSTHVNGKDIMYDELNAGDLTELLDVTFADASALDSAASSLTSQFGPPPAKIQTAITFPWLNPNVHNLQLPGLPILDMANPSDRLTAASWYLDEIKNRAAAANWQQLELYGAYYHREDASDVWGDPSFVQGFNSAAHSRGLKTIWVPYYDAPQGWNGAGLGFDVTNVQPSYSFRSPIDGSDVNGGRLYSAGYKAAGQGQSIEYELRGQGETQTENWMAHQYLAVSQSTGASNYPQVFFTGLNNDVFDRTTSQAGAQGDMWWAYSDLANYLAGQTISNMEIGINWQPTTLPNGSLQQIWQPGTGPKLTSVRLDFNDSTSMQNPWRGRITVKVDGPSGSRTAFAQRSGTADINPSYNSVFVALPVPDNGDQTVTKLTITMTRETGSPWPTVQRLVGAQYEPIRIASSNFEETSTATRVVQSGPYADSVATHLSYGAGKLTNGLKSPNGSWGWGGAMGWNMIEGRFSTTIDLGSNQNIASVDITTHSDQQAGINWPIEVAATAATCPPHARGLSTKSCLPLVSSGLVTKTSQLVPGTSFEHFGTLSMPITGNARYVTVTGLSTGWALLDEIEVKNSAGTVISTDKPYTVTPKPSVGQNDRLAYGDDSHKLVDGAISGDFFSMMDVGVQSNVGGNVESTWVSPKTVNTATVWLTKAFPSSGILTPDSVSIQWRNQTGQWQPGVSVVPQASCGPAPCAKLSLPGGPQATGLRATFPAQTTWEGWFMVTELSAR